MKITKDRDGDCVVIIENLNDAEFISKQDELILCECAVCGEYFFNDMIVEHIHFEEHEKNRNNIGGIYE